MNSEELNAMKVELEKKINELKEKTKDSLDTAKIKSMYAKDKIEEMADERKGNLNAMKENFRLFSDKVKGKASAELLKAQMNMDVAKEQLVAKKVEHDKALMEEYIDETIEYAAACVELSLLAAEEAQLAVLEAVATEEEYEELYGEK